MEIRSHNHSVKPQGKILPSNVLEQKAESVPEESLDQLLLGNYVAKHSSPVRAILAAKAALTNTLRAASLAISSPVHWVSTWSAQQSFHQDVHQAVKPTTLSPDRAQAFARIEGSLKDPNAQVVASVPLSGINSPSLVLLSNGAVGIWKKNGATSKIYRSNIPANGQNDREKFSYQLDKAADHYGRVLPSIGRKLGDEEGVISPFLRGSVPANAHMNLEGLAQPEHPGYHRLAVTDNIHGQLDRHDENWLVSSCGAESFPVAIDYGLSHPTKNEKQGPYSYRFDQNMSLNTEDREALQRLQSQAEKLYEEAPTSMKEDGSVQATFQRVAQMLNDDSTSDSWRDSRRNRH